MRAFALPADDSACGYYRIKAPAAALTALGINVQVAEPRFPQHTQQGTVEAPVLLNPEGADVIVCHRPSFPALVDELERLQRQGYPLVVDVDDDLSCLPRQIPGRVGSLMASLAQARACEMADLVTCSTPALAERYGAHGRVRVLRNRVPASMLDMSRESDGSTLGWAGLASGHLGDLPTTGGAVADALEGSGWTFTVIGPEEDVRQQLGLGFKPHATGGLSLEGYQEALGMLDVGIVPLADTPFNRAKSGLKGLEYAARGVPFIASDLPEYAALGRERIGLAVRNPSEWYTALKGLIREGSLRSELVSLGRTGVAASHTYEGNADRWPEAWEAAITNARSR